MSRRIYRKAIFAGMWLPLCAITVLGSCQMLGESVPVYDPVTGEETGTTTVGEVIAGSAETVADTAGTIVGGVTGNPIFGIAASAAVLGLFGARRRKKNAAVVSE